MPDLNVKRDRELAKIGSNTAEQTRILRTLNDNFTEVGRAIIEMNRTLETALNMLASMRGESPSDYAPTYEQPKLTPAEIEEMLEEKEGSGQ
jgi:uncharacterized coiled-coil protein SlyX